MLVKTYQPLDAEQLIRSGCLPVGSNDPLFPAKLAAFLRHLNRRQPYRLNRRPGAVGSIDTVNAASQSQLALAWDVAVSTGLPSPLRATGPNQTVATNQRAAVSYTFGTTGAGTINQVAQKTITVTNGVLNHFAIDVWTKNVVNDASATFSAFRELWIELLTIAQGGGATSSSIIIGADAGQKWVGLLNAAGTITVKAGGLWLSQDQTATGIAITTGDLLQFNNADAGNIASIRLTGFGYK